MPYSHRPDEILTILRTGRAPELPRLLAAAVKAHLCVSETEILLVDYRQSALTAMDTAADPVPVDGSPEGRAFSSQEPVVAPHGPDTVRLLCPLTARGQRLGVLAGTFTEPPDAETRAQWQELAADVAHEIVVAEQTTDRFRRARRRRRLTLAAEIQWDTLPARSVTTPEYSFAGQLEPAYEICGDTFDWSVDETGLTAVVVNGSNHGTSAAVLTNFVIAALRNARRSGDDVAAQMSLASDLLYTEHGGARSVDALGLRYEPAGHLLLAASTGSARMVRLHGTSVSTVDLPAQPQLGSDEEIEYRATRVEVAPGDRVLVVSDGVHTAVNPAREAFGLAALGQVLRRTRLQPCGEAVRTVIRDSVTHHGSALDDDAVVTCLDVHPTTPH
ncbi:PP2C family protein-serine/threonine phosphatase [Actinocatenispora rupis]|uniref:Phosphatase n=1 Tax=Actinocatenispora rupis TaxID=519421 RepID=A0A8J3NGF5_9ACTN|nr:PP2C family protein-serine/threonine phosphatase [Actinocatenispora rupis]GID16372.1 phosphatase [Actinocatenispora rupis]